MNKEIFIISDVDEHESILNKALKVDLLYRNAANYKTSFSVVVPYDENTKYWKIQDDIEMGSHPYLPKVMEFFDSILHPYCFNPEEDHNLLEILKIETCDPICIGLFWSDPEIITGNDYQITDIKIYQESQTALIQYGGGSEAEVPLSEIGKFDPEHRTVTYPFANQKTTPA